MSLRSVAPAFGAALLFGASTPLAKLLGLGMAPQLLAGLLYLGSGVGLAGVMLARHLLRTVPERPARALRVPRKDIPWLAGAIVTGGIGGPLFLLAGLRTTDAAAASLLLNLEGLLTSLIAWRVFQENADRRVVLGMVALVAGGVLLSVQPETLRWSPGALLILGACLCWAVDNNLTRQVSTNDALLVAGLKGLVAGVTNTGLALALGAQVPAAGPLLASLLLGFVGYGLSLALFVVALRGLGTWRTGAYFSVAPLFGVLVSLALWPAPPAGAFWLAAVLMAAGVWLHLGERHDHDHTHPPQEHEHSHVHDEHHRHEHDFAWDGLEPHVHPHRHAVLTHRHAHFPDVHHRHVH